MLLYTLARLRRNRCAPACRHESCGACRSTRMHAPSWAMLHVLVRAGTGRAGAQQSSQITCMYVSCTCLLLSQVCWLTMPGHGWGLCLFNPCTAVLISKDRCLWMCGSGSGSSESALTSSCSPVCSCNALFKEDYRPIVFVNTFYLLAWQL